jgi:hypothetical protein
MYELSFSYVIFQNQDVSKKCSKEEKILKSRSLYDAVSDVEVGFIT